MLKTGEHCSPLQRFDMENDNRAIWGSKEFYMKMKELPLSERPYEKLEYYGAGKLSNAELLAIIIKTGTKEKSAVATPE